MKTIKDLDINKINEAHLIELDLGYKFFRRTEGNPLDFHYNDTTLTTKVLLDQIISGKVGLNSVNCCAINIAQGAFAETKWKLGLKLYEIIVKKCIERILDLDRVCEEQEIEAQYLHLHATESGRDPNMEKELFNLYGKEIREKRIHGVKYRSRRYPEATCYMFYDTLPGLSEYLDYRDITNEYP
jgi:hypothetical protein